MNIFKSLFCIIVMLDFFDDLFNPKTVALIGATSKKGKVGNTIFKNLLDSGVKVVPVNINRDWIGFHKVYHSVLDYKDKIDLAIIAIPARFVPNVLEECGQKGIRSAIVISAGFGEVSNDELSHRVDTICNKYKISMLGPNCLGVINSANGYNFSFFKGVPEKGDISFVSQSGALGVAMLDKAIKNRIGMSKFVSIGNMLNTHFYEFVEYFNRDKDTKVIAAYIEGLKSGKKLIRVLGHLNKPLVVLKAGRTEKGEKAVGSHTGSLAGSNKVYKGVFKQFGVFYVDTLDELFTVSRILSKGVKSSSNRLCIVTNAGGAGVLATDSAELSGFEVVELPKEVKDKLSEILPSNWSKNNPIDIIGDAPADRYKAVFNVLSNKNFYDIVLCILTPQDMSEPLKTAEYLIEFAKKNKDKMVFSCFMGGRSVDSAINKIEKEGMFNFVEPATFARVVSKIVK